MQTTPLSTLLSRAEAVLFDFDGPICQVFSALPAPDVAAEIINIFRGQIAFPQEARHETDPLEVLRTVAAFIPDSITAAEDTLSAAELIAVRNAAPTPGAAESIEACAKSSIAVAIVSNNSAEAVKEYLDAHGLLRYVSAIAGRAYADPSKMKPNPEPIHRALTTLTIEPSVAIFIGDSATDVQACRAASIPCVGYVDKPQKRRILGGADILIEDMSMISKALRAC